MRCGKARTQAYRWRRDAVSSCNRDAQCRQVHDACNWLPKWQSTCEPKPYVMYSLRHGVNLSRRACRIRVPLLLLIPLLLLAVDLAAGSPFSTNTRPQPDPQPIPEDYSHNRPYDGMDFGPLGPSTYNEPGSQKTDNLGMTSPCITTTSSSGSQEPENTGPIRYQVASVSFHRVKTPFIIGLWIFCASLAKIGKKNLFFVYYYVKIAGHKEY